MVTPDVPELPTLLDLFRRPSWHAQAACRGVGIERFILERGCVSRRDLCDGCPVRAECLEAALTDPELVGLWGGTTERERCEMRREVAKGAG
jgi:WhiB family transcriptional regulator, redox-sensing transcriptional regulator